MRGERVYSTALPTCSLRQRIQRTTGFLGHAGKLYTNVFIVQHSAHKRLTSTCSLHDRAMPAFTCCVAKIVRGKRARTPCGGYANGTLIKRCLNTGHCLLAECIVGLLDFV